MEGQLLKLLTELGVPPAIVGLIVSGFIWIITRRIREDLQSHKESLDNQREDIDSLKQRVNDVEKEAMQKYVSRDDWLVCVQRIEAKLDYLQRHGRRTE